MATTNILNWKKEKVGTVELPKEVFEVPVKKEILHEVVQWQLAKRRQGTHMVKTRGLVSGGGKKPFKQKGTGNARQGSNRSPLMPGGAKLFGPVPRSYAYALPKKVKKLGLKMALSHLHQEGKLFVIESMKSDGKTKELAQRLKSFGLSKAVLVDVKSDDQFKRAANNLPKHKYFAAEGLNVFDLLKYDAAVITKETVAFIVSRCEVE
ncbi:MAG: 50S ribosomal protein L4 [Bdellovibrio sp. CG10_big_fil_rev_8_21_14_0_10_47_8]|nr:MAG: 50S ribosomal protein L4 [Bdellovibrio sp. CG10_big_fil_rev_8_21_14_0_10_47_8]